MSELQATIEFQIELSKFYNLDLFQRGYYQIRVSMKCPPKAPIKLETTMDRRVPSNADQVVGGFVVDNIGVSKTFQILYKNEDVTINDVFMFRLHLLVDSQKIEESIEKADLQMSVELWFTDENYSSETSDQIQCVSQKTLKLHFSPSKGIHHQLPIIFDYFHLCVMCMTVHGTLVALHQPYISLPKNQKSGWNKNQEPSTLESVLFGSRTSSLNTPRQNMTNKLKHACRVHKEICRVLLSAYESLQNAFEQICQRLPTHQQLKIEHADCHGRLDSIMEVIVTFDDDEDLLQTANSNVAQLCAENLILWSQYLEMVSLNDHATQVFSMEHHQQRTKRFSEAYFTHEHMKQHMLSAFEPSVHGHVDLYTVVKTSPYFLNLPPLIVECTEMDGDAETLPVIFEDIFTENLHGMSVGDLSLTVADDDDSGYPRSELPSSLDLSDSSAKNTSKPKSKLKFIKNIKPETLKRPSHSLRTNTVAHDTAKYDATLIGFKKISTDDDMTLYELGTLDPTTVEPHKRPKSMSAISMPSLFNSHLNREYSGSMPDLSIHRASYSPSIARLRNLKTGSLCEGDLASRSGSFAQRHLGVSIIGEQEEMVESDDSSGQQVADVMINGVEMSPEGGASSGSGSQVSSPDNNNTDVPSISVTNESDSAQLLAKSLTDALTETVNISSPEHVTDLFSNPADVAISSDVATKSSDVATNSSDVIIAKASDDDVDDASQVIDDGVVSRTKSSKVDVVVDSNLELAKQTIKQPSALGARTSGETYSETRRLTVMDLLKEEYLHSQQHRNSLTGGDGLSERPSSMVMSSSSPELCELQQTADRRRLVSQIGDKTVNFVTIKEELKRQLRYHGHLYSDFASAACSVPYFLPLGPGKYDDDLHLIVCVHGLDGNCADLRLVRTYLELALPNSKVDFLMSERNQPDTFADFEAMTQRLVDEINYHIDMFSLVPAKISFIGHSLGNLIIRSALSHPDLAYLLPKMHTFLSLSGPHLGTLYNQSGLVNMGMWFMQKWKKSGSMLQLALKDNTDIRQTYIYKLSQKPCLEYFKNVLVVASSQDRYVPYHSARIEICKNALKDSSPMGSAYVEMVNNILQPILGESAITFVRYDVFHALPNTANSLIGRAAHIAVLDSELFLEKYFTVSAVKYFK